MLYLPKTQIYILGMSAKFYDKAIDYNFAYR